LNFPATFPAISHCQCRLDEQQCGMATPRKRSPLKPKRKTATGLTLREIQSTKGRVKYSAFLVQGWSENGKRQRRQFKTEAEARRFISDKQVALLNDVPIHTVITRLTPEQIAQAESAFSRLAGRATLDEAISHFLAKAAPPEKAVELRPALRDFLIAKEGQGLRQQSLDQLESTLTRFCTYAEGRGINHVHDADSATVEQFLRSLRAKDGVERATPKTWNNYRADLSTFFSWCRDPRRRWILANPCEGVTKVKLDGIGEPDRLTIAQAARLMRDAQTSHGGKLARYFALALFAGIRPGPKGELYKLAKHPERDRLIDLKMGIITIPPEVSKTRQKRQIVIRPALRAWLEATAPEILPTNADRNLKQMRKRHALTHDILRHSFISFHVGAFRSIGDAALEAGNSESVIKAHYLNLATSAQGKAFWRIAPKGQRIAREAVVQESKILRIA
jgi:hypothetical protein